MYLARSIPVTVSAVPVKAALTRANEKRSNSYLFLKVIDPGITYE